MSWQRLFKYQHTQEEPNGLINPAGEDKVATESMAKMLNRKKEFLMRELEKTSEEAAEYILEKQNSTSVIQNALADEFPLEMQKRMMVVSFHIKMIQAIEGTA